MLISEDLLFKYTRSSFLSCDDLYVFGCVCFGSQEKVRRACPEFIQAAELRFQRQPLPPPHSFWGFFTKQRTGSVSSGQRLFGKEKKDQFASLPEHCAVCLDSFQCKCQKETQRMFCND